VSWQLRFVLAHTSPSDVVTRPPVAFEFVRSGPVVSSHARAGGGVPVVFRKIERLCEFWFATTISTRPSPSRSPVTTFTGAEGVGRSGCAVMSITELLLVFR